MDFAFSGDQQLLKNAARAFLDERCTSAVVRGLWDDPRTTAEDVRAILDTMGDA